MTVNDTEMHDTNIDRNNFNPSEFVYPIGKLSLILISNIKALCALLDDYYFELFVLYQVLLTYIQILITCNRLDNKFANQPVDKLTCSRYS